MRPRLLVAASIAAACLAAHVAPAGAQQYQRGAVSVQWQIPNVLFTNWEQDITVTDNATNTFFNIQWTKAYGPTGYLGIQRLSTGNWFLFSMWGATDWQVPGHGGSCRTFVEAGSPPYNGGRQCYTPIGASIENRTIRLKLIKSNRTNDNDFWWSAWADLEGLPSMYLGQLKAPHAGWLQGALNFQEYFGSGAGWDGSRCVPPGPPSSSAVYGPPTISSPVLAPRKLAMGAAAENTCPGTGGTVLPFFDGVYMHLGDN